MSLFGLAVWMGGISVEEGVVDPASIPAPFPSSGLITARPVYIRCIYCMYEVRISINQCCGSGSALIFSPGSGTKMERLKIIKNKTFFKDIGNNYNYIKIRKINLDKLNVFFYFRAIFFVCFFNYSKLFTRYP